jgi:hypothetical protein
MIAPPFFPPVAPYRIDQVSAAPLLLAGLFLGQVMAALLIHLAAAWRRPRLWLAGVGMLLVLVLVFFTLASWGNSDTTRFSHMMEWDPEQAPPELLWRLLRPVVLLLPYRMAAVQGLVVAAFAAAAILLASAWRAWAWAGWWSLLVCCSPLLRGFMQTAHSRQALATLLLLPVLLRSARLVPVPARWLGLGVALSAISHNTFLWNLPLSLSPWAVRPLEPPVGELVGPRQEGAGRAWRGRRLRLLLAGLAGGAILLVLLAPVALDRFLDYSQDEYFSDYALRPIVGRLQRAMATGLVLACLQHRLTPLRLLRCPITLLLLGFGLLYLGIQLSIAHLWLPQITSRLADGVAFFQLILFLAWLDRYRAHWCVIPALYVTFQYWFEGRILRSGSLACGRNDEFLCIPDRWPWQVRY